MHSVVEKGKGEKIEMLKAIKSYFVFTSWSYRIIIFLIVPTIMLGIDFFLDKTLLEPGGFIQTVFMLMQGVLLVIAETIGEYWFLAGIHSKKRKCMEYLKTSNGFLECMKVVLTVDTVRRFLLIGLMFFFMGNFDIQSVDGLTKWGEKSACMLVVMAIAQTSVWVARHMIMINFVFLTAYLSGIVVLFLMLLALYFPLVCSMIAIVYIIGFSIFSIWYTLRKVKGGYYDRRFKIRD